MFSVVGGKITLLRALSRVLPCTGGIVMNNRNLVRMTSDQAFAVGLVQVPEGRQLFDRMSVQDNLLMGAFRRDDKGRSHATWKKCMCSFRAYQSATVSWREACRAVNSKCAPWPWRDGGANPADDRRDEFGLAPVIVEQLTGVLATIR
jgi:branched-chain amino acid transport system ATP-binding protein